MIGFAAHYDGPSTACEGPRAEPQTWINRKDRRAQEAQRRASKAKRKGRKRNAVR